MKIKYINTCKELSMEYSEGLINVFQLLSAKKGLESAGEMRQGQNATDFTSFAWQVNISQPISIY